MAIYTGSLITLRLGQMYPDFPQMYELPQSSRRQKGDMQKVRQTLEDAPTLGDKRTAPFSLFTWRVVISYRRFGTTCQSHLQDGPLQAA